MVRRVLVLSVLAVSALPAQAQQASNDVNIIMNLAVEEPVTLSFNRDVVLGPPVPGTYLQRRGVTRGCLTTGFGSGVEVSMAGQNQPSGTQGFYLLDTSGKVYLRYRVSLAMFMTNTSLINLYNAGTQGETDITAFPRGHENMTGLHGCDGGYALQLGANVYEDTFVPASYDERGADPEAFPTVETMLAGTGLGAGDYTFSDVLTITITPRLRT